MTDDCFLALTASNSIASTQPRSSGMSGMSGALLEAVVARRFCVEFHPVIGNDDTLLAWRAKARFSDTQGRPLSSRAVLAALHANPPLLLATELQLKSLALAHAPRTAEILLPLDADSYAAAGSGNAHNAFDQMFAHHPQAVVEICENQPMVDVARLHRLLHRLARSGTSLAVRQQTPVAACLSELMQEADWLRIPCPPDLRDPRHVRALEAIAEAARQNGKMAIVSNVPDATCLAVIRAIGFAGACGPVFRSKVMVSPEALPQKALEQGAPLSIRPARPSSVRRVSAG